MEYTEIKHLEGTVDQVNAQLKMGWVVIGIQQHREWWDERVFFDKTTYILGKKAEAI